MHEKVNYITLDQLYTFPTEIFKQRWDSAAVVSEEIGM